MVRRTEAATTGSAILPAFTCLTPSASASTTVVCRAPPCHGSADLSRSTRKPLIARALAASCAARSRSRMMPVTPTTSATTAVASTDTPSRWRRTNLAAV